MRHIISTTIACLALIGCSVSPKPLERSDLALSADDYRLRVTADQEPLSGPVGLYEAMARALKYNLDRRVEMMEAALRRRELRLTSHDMLPQLVANGGYAGRNNFSGASSRSLISGVQSLEPSTSSERNVLTADLRLSWDILDFGLSYIRAKQAADEVLIAEERRRKVVNRIIEDVRTAYWRAVSSQRLARKLRRLQGDVERELAASRDLEQREQTSPLTALTFQRELVEIKQEIQRLDRELHVAKLQLAALMNLDPGQDFRIAVPRRRINSAVLRGQSRSEMIRTALENRPELREVAYRKRINDKEAQAAILELFPSLKSYAGLNADSNDFLYNNDWVSWGAQASWNLLKVFSYPRRKATIAAQDDLLDARALALTMAIITQVDVSRARYRFLRRELATSSEYYGIQRRILDQIRAGAEADTVSRQTLIREEMNTLVAEVRYDIAYADLQNAYAALFTTIGLDPFGMDVTGQESVADLAGSLEALWASRGDRTARPGARTATARNTRSAGRSAEEKPVPN
jgi:outer membrane protein TolC